MAYSLAWRFMLGFTVASYEMHAHNPFTPRVMHFIPSNINLVG
jgi:hypothetical protein